MKNKRNIVRGIATSIASLTISKSVTDTIWNELSGGDTVVDSLLSALSNMGVSDESIDHYLSSEILGPDYAHNRTNLQAWVDRCIADVQP